MILNEILITLLVAALAGFGVGIVVAALRFRSPDRHADCAPIPVATRAVRPPASQTEPYRPE